MSVKKVIVFDLDGTLIDSVRDLLPALNATIALDDVPPVPCEDVGKVVGQGGAKMIEFAFDLAGRALDHERHNQLLKIFLEKYEADIATHTVYFDGVFEALAQLRESGWCFAICTNKYERLARKFLALSQMENHFSAVTGGDTFEFKKPDGRHIIRTAEMAGGNAKSMIMVGDSINDIAAAHDVGVPSIAVDFGYTDIPVKDMNATAVISHFDALAETVAQIKI